MLLSWSTIIRSYSWINFTWRLWYRRQHMINSWESAACCMPVVLSVFAQCPVDCTCHDEAAWPRKKKEEKKRKGRSCGAVVKWAKIQWKNNWWAAESGEGVSRVVNTITWHSDREMHNVSESDLPNNLTALHPPPPPPPKKKGVPWTQKFSPLCG